jgi:hypothetical protein
LHRLAFQICRAFHIERINASRSSKD